MNLKREKCALIKKCLETSAGTQQNPNCGCRKVASLTLPSFARLPCDIMAGFTWLIKFLSDYGHIPDPFPWCGIGSGHARLLLNSHLTSRPWGHSQCIHYWMGLSNWRYNILILNWPCSQAHTVSVSNNASSGSGNKVHGTTPPHQSSCGSFHWLTTYLWYTVQLSFLRFT